MAETLKVNNDVAESSPVPAGFFYRRIGGTLFKVRVYTGSGYVDTLDEKITRLIRNEVMTGGGNCGMMDSPQMKDIIRREPGTANVRSADPTQKPGEIYT